MAASVEHSQTLSGEAAETGRRRPLNGLDGDAVATELGPNEGRNQPKPTNQALAVLEEGTWRRGQVPEPRYPTT